MNDRDHYKRFSAKLCEELPAALRILKLPSSWTLCHPTQDCVLDRKRFEGAALVGESVDDADKIKTLQKQRLKRLYRLLQCNLLLNVFDPSVILSGLCDYDKYKSIHTVFSRLSDVHLLLVEICRRVSEKHSDGSKQLKGYLGKVLEIYRQIFKEKELRVKRHQSERELGYS